VAATLLILRATELVTPGASADAATRTALMPRYRVQHRHHARQLPAGRAGDRRGGVTVMATGAALFSVACIGLAATGPIGGGPCCSASSPQMPRSAT
jgi:hypothetical protein